jgi:hypothetical protein
MIPFFIPPKIPTLNLGEFIGQTGYTGYIDFIKLSQMTYPIMRGIDSFNRRFVVIKMNINNVLLFQTFFQRYTDSEGLWMGAGHHGCHLIATEGGMKDIQFKLIEDIINNKIVKITQEHKPCDPYFIDKYVCGVNVYNATLKIQKAWRLCRYDPKYKMCETIQMRNLHDIVEEYN